MKLCHITPILYASPLAQNHWMCYLLTKSSQPPNVNICIILSMSNLFAALALHLLSSLLDHQHHIRQNYWSLLSICFSLSLWNQLTISLRQPHSRFSIPESFIPAHVFSFSVDSSFSSSTTLPLFHSQLKNVPVLQKHRWDLLVKKFSLKQSWLHRTTMIQLKK